MTTIQQTSFDEALAAFPSSVRDDIATIKTTNGVLTADRVEKICTTIGAEIGTLMIQLLPVAATYAIVPVSNYRVGAVSQGMPVGGWSSLYLGANFEFVGQALSFTVHAEQAATNNAWLNGQQGLQSLAISAAPCGYCRQFLYELVTQPQFNILLPTGQGDNYTLNPLTYYLPDAFGPRDLGLTGGLMDPKYCTHALKLQSGSNDPLALAALAGAQGCYSPYTKSYCGCAVMTTSGAIFQGRYAENAAYNPSLSPLESALSFMNMSQENPGALSIQRAALVTVQSPPADQVGATTDVLSAYTKGQVKLETYIAVPV
ncbi:MAG: cytidine deaminase [Fimbriimonadaceae bacterium]|nr:cytidine deaminase [Fimbriimonadaceae bacterium]